MAGSPRRKAARHVQAAIAVGQAKMGRAVGEGRPVAAHVQAAIGTGRGVQAKMGAVAPESPTCTRGPVLAPHVRAAVAQARVKGAGTPQAGPQAMANSVAGGLAPPAVAVPQKVIQRAALPDAPSGRKLIPFAEGPTGRVSLRDGDVLLLRDTSEATHKLIKVGQSAGGTLGKGESSVTHVAIYAGGENMIEASGASGLVRSALGDKPYKWDYLVFRYSDTGVANSALSWAQRWLGRRDSAKRLGKSYGGYTKKGAVKSIVYSSSFGSGAKSYIADLFLGKDVEFFCSNFVVACYDVAHFSRTMDITTSLPWPFGLDARYVSPRRVHGFLMSSGAWTYLGIVDREGFDPSDPLWFHHADFTLLPEPE